MEDYSNVFLPLPDIYNLGGSEVFEALERDSGKEKNLIVIPSFIADSLTSWGGEDALNSLKELEDKRKKIGEGFVCYSVGEGLDVVYVEVDSGGLEKKLKEKNFVDPTGKSKVLTSDSKEHLRYLSRGHVVEPPKFLMVDKNVVYKGIISGKEKLQAKLFENGRKVPLNVAEDILGVELYHNQFVRFRVNDGFEFAQVVGDLVRNKDGSRIIDVKNPVLKLSSDKDYGNFGDANWTYRIGNQYRKDFFGIAPKDFEQYLAVQKGILNFDSSVVFVGGCQGSGKTLVSYTAAVDLILKYEDDERKKRCCSRDLFFNQIVLLKPNNAMGGKDRGLGFLPGDHWLKVKPHLGPFIDSHEESRLDDIPFLEMILDPRRSNDFGPKRQEKLKANGAYLPPNKAAIHITDSSYLRGRSFKNTLILVDEAQNFTPYEMKTTIERLGENSKIIIMGDTVQFDNPRCSKDINGLTSAINHYLKAPYSFLMYLPNNYRNQASLDSLSWKVCSDSK